MAEILDGKLLAEKIKIELRSKILLKTKKPGLAAILVGDNPASDLYVKLKEKFANEVGIQFHKYLCNEKCYPDIPESGLIELVEFLNKDKEIDGILLQLPLPEKYDTQKIINTINPEKDADGFHPKNKTGLVPPPIAAVIELLKETGEKLTAKNLLIIGKSDIFTLGLEKYLKKELKIKKIASEKAIPKNSAEYDIIIIGLGQAHILKKKHVKSGAIIIDIGINKLEGKTVGDVDPKVSEIAEYLSPVPGGVGPLTVACLMRNVYELSKE